MKDLLNAIAKKPACGCDTRYASQRNQSDYDYLAHRLFGQPYHELTLDQQIIVTDRFDERD